MNILNLTLKKKWFDMILSGEKKHEYREIKPYWTKRLFKNYDAINFVNGYGKHRPQFLIEIKYIDSGFGLVKWGAIENKMVYILRLGKIISEVVT